MPLGEVAKVGLAQGPSSIRTEDAQLALYIFVDLRDRDLGGYVAEAKKAGFDDNEPLPGDRVQEVVKRILDIPDEAKSRLRKLLGLH